jgi:hypothetical protein
VARRLRRHAHAALLDAAASRRVEEQELRVMPFLRRYRTGKLHAPQPTTSTSALSSATTSLHWSKQQSDIALKACVANVCSKCFRSFRGML